MTEKITNNTRANLYLEQMDSVPEFVAYTHWEHIQNRKIVLNFDIDSNVVEYVTLQILKFNEEDKDIPVEKRKPILVYINSNGGSVSDGFNVIDVILASKTPIHTICLAAACSMAGYILMAGHKRFAYNNSTILIHDGSLVVQSTTKKADQTMNYFRKLNKRVKDFVLDRTKIDEKLYDEKEGEEWYLLSDECLELGIIDEIIV